MNNKDIKLKQDLIATTRAIKKKFQELHNDKVSLEEHLEERYKPITTSLKRLIENQAVNHHIPQYRDDKQFYKEDDPNVSHLTAMTMILEIWKLIK